MFYPQPIFNLTAFPDERDWARRLYSVADRFHDLSTPSPGLNGLHARGVPIQKPAHRSISRSGERGNAEASVVVALTPSKSAISI
jgi:hypothetical protein